MFAVDEEGRAICLFGIRTSLDYDCQFDNLELLYGELGFFGGDTFALRVTFVDDWMREYINLKGGGEV